MHAPVIDGGSEAVVTLGPGGQCGAAAQAKHACAGRPALAGRNAGRQGGAGVAADADAIDAARVNLETCEFPVRG